MNSYSCQCLCKKKFSANENTTNIIFFNRDKQINELRLRCARFIFDAPSGWSLLNYHAAKCEIAPRRDGRALYLFALFC